MANPESVRQNLHEKNALRYLPSIAVVKTMALLLLTACSITLVVGANALWRGVKELRSIETHRQVYVEAVRSLSTGSLALTDAVRRFVTTGERSTMDEYFKEARVDRHREQCFDLLATLPPNPVLEAKLKKSMETSVRLMETEYQAMKLAARWWKLPEEALPKEVRSFTLSAADEALTGRALRDRALDLVFGHAYHDAQRIILEGGKDELQHAVDLERNKMDDLLRLQRGRYTTHLVTMGCLIALIVLLAVLLVLGERQRHRVIEIALREKTERDRVEAANKAKNMFFSSVSHDIRTPLNAIIGFTQLLRSGKVPSEEVPHDLAMIEASGKTLLELINDILDLSKLEEGRMTIVPEPTDIRRLVGDLVPVFEQMTRESHQKIVTEIGSLPRLMLDPHRFQQILFNLVGNAVKYAGPCTIRIQAKYAAGRLSFAVSDDGVGVSEENLQRLFLPYAQAANAKHVQGTGLGLAICKKLLESGGGGATLESVQGQGFTFRGELPIQQAEGMDVKEVKGTTPHAVASTHSLPARVLVVDDALVNRLVILSQLRNLGVTDIVMAENGDAALKVLQSDPNGFNMVFTDMWMPVLDGEGLIHAIRQRAEWKDLPVYAVTADVAVQKTYRRDGFTGILLKPVTLENLQKLFA